MKFIGFVLRDYIKHFFELFIGVEIIFFERPEERIGHSNPLSPSCGAGKQVVLSAQGQRANSIFNPIIVYFQGSIYKIVHQFVLTRDAICYCCFDGLFWQDSFVCLHISTIHLLNLLSSGKDSSSLRLYLSSGLISASLDFRSTAYMF